MKRVYEKPVMEAECFEANEYVAACYTVNASCNIYSEEADWADNYNIDGYVVSKTDGLWHGTACQSNTFYWNDQTLTGYENSTGSTIYDVTDSGWKSKDKAGNTYIHTGTVYKTPDSSRPNHS